MRFLPLSVGYCVFSSTIAQPPPGPGLESMENGKWVTSLRLVYDVAITPPEKEHPFVTSLPAADEVPNMVAHDPMHRLGASHRFLPHGGSKPADVAHGPTLQSQRPMV